AAGVVRRGAGAVETGNGEIIGTWRARSARERQAIRVVEEINFGHAPTFDDLLQDLVVDVEVVLVERSSRYTAISTAATSRCAPMNHSMFSGARPSLGSPSCSRQGSDDKQRRRGR